ncbi:MAG: hypothetical protein NG712_03875 [Omnitrophica bacterium]|nr:hypothetical protein [Candidatus Omnitrophota bacterium]
MSKKLNRFYRISIWTISILIAGNILVKAVIWFSSSKESKPDYHYPMYIRKHIGELESNRRFTTRSKQKLFNKIDYLLMPAFTIFFIVVTVKLINRPKIFEESD